MGKREERKERSPPPSSPSLSLIFVKYAAARGAVAFFLRDGEREKRRAAGFTLPDDTHVAAPVGWVYFGRGGF